MDWLKNNEADLYAWFSQWRDTALHARYCGLPSSLDAVGNALGFGEDKKKMAIGKRLIGTFSVPRKPTARDSRTRVMPVDEPEKWQLYIDYNRRDVETEMHVDAALAAWPVPEEVQREWVLDQVQQMRGVAIDSDLVDGALEIMAAKNAALLEEGAAITGLDNPNSTVQLRKWLNDAIDGEQETLRKADVAELLKTLPDGDAKRMMEIRQELSKTSTKKFNAMRVAVCHDGRIRGLIQFYGANRTGRFSGKLVQIQNLPRTYLHGDALTAARELTKKRDMAALECWFDNVPDTLSQLIRTAFVPAPGKIYMDADFSAIEARVIAWIAGEETPLKEFRTTGKIYERTASEMFHVPFELIKKGNPEYKLRAQGKVAVLACGFGGGPAAMARMDFGHDIPEDQYQACVDMWRAANPNIVKLWREVEDAAIRAIETGAKNRILLMLPYTNLFFELEESNGLRFLTIQLPSGRKLFYADPGLTTNKWGATTMSYMGVNQVTRKWERGETYGGKLTENIVQAASRDLLVDAMRRCEEAGMKVVFHIHDEMVVESKTDRLEEMIRIMSTGPQWAAGLPLNADGWTDIYFRKDG